MSPPNADQYSAVGLRIGTDGQVEGAFVPPGVILFHAGLDLPNGYLECDGAAHLVATYPDLYAIIGNLYGGAGPITFRTPNLAGRFPRFDAVPGASGQLFYDNAGLSTLNYAGLRGIIKT